MVALGALGVVSNFLLDVPRLVVSILRYTHAADSSEVPLLVLFSFITSCIFILLGMLRRSLLLLWYRSDKSPKLAGQEPLLGEEAKVPAPADSAHGAANDGKPLLLVAPSL